VHRIRDHFYPKTALNPDRIVELDVIVRDAVDLKCMVAQLRKSIKRVDPYFSALSMTIEKYTF
jgi:hypothetical protein